MNYSTNTERSVILAKHMEKHGGSTLRGVSQDIGREALFNASVPFAIGIASKYSSYQVDMDDLIQQALLGVWDATEKFDPNNGAGFLTYAKWWCRARIQEYLAEMSGPMRVPMWAFAAKKGGGGSECLDAAASALRPPVSINAEVGDSGPPLSDMIASCGPMPDSVLDGGDYELVSRAMCELTDRERLAISRYYGLDGGGKMSFEDVGKAIGLSREGARLSHDRGLESIRKILSGSQATKPAPRGREVVVWDDTTGMPDCPHCGDSRINRNGYTSSGGMEYRLYRCQGCFVSGRGTVAVAGRPAKR